MVGRWSMFLGHLTRSVYDGIFITSVTLVIVRIVDRDDDRGDEMPYMSYLYYYLRIYGNLTIPFLV